MSATPVVYFIDDSATMREVIKIAFRRENINVIACHDAASAVDLMEQNAPDVVISDVIMPDKDGYEVCQYIKQHPRLGRTPVVLMSGVVNRSVAEKAFAVKADELIRKPFQPQDLIARVRHLLNPRAASAAPVPQPQVAASAAALSSIFSGVAPKPTQPRPTLVAPTIPAAAARTAAPPSLAATAASAMNPANPAPPVTIPGAQITGASAALPAQPGAQSRVPPPPPSSNMDQAKMRVELMRLQSQIKKLESELKAEREYSRALEEHIKTLQEAE
ncbi:MAG TPA: response regulator [Clostridia bacterium]|nr:response regulator [Clostridia bacterium]